VILSDELEKMWRKIVVSRFKAV